MRTKIIFKKRKLLIILIIIHLFLITLISIVGLSFNNVYSKETHNWYVQCIAQDIIDLFLVVPLLLISGFFMLKGNLKWTYIWLGGMFYIFYTFILYCFTIHFNFLFLAYCATLGLTFYTIVAFIISIDKKSINTLSFTVKSSKNIAWYLLIVAISFLIMWLSDIIPAIISNQTPQTVLQGGMFTNPVQVIDLSFLLPAMFILSISIYRGNRSASLIAPVFLSFSFVMSFALFIMMFYMFIQNEVANMIPSILMIILSIIGFVFFLRLKENSL